VAKGGRRVRPFIFIATNRLKPGKLADERKRVPGLVDFVEANEPRLIAFNEYVNDDGTEVAVVQIHPDAESMALSLPNAPSPHMPRRSTRLRASRCSGRRAVPSLRCWSVRPRPACR
jgi:hypothetical protein